MNRIAILLVVLLPAIARAAKPNIVLFIADDYSWHDSGTYGAKDVRTPNIDQLARDGMQFDAAFAASPTCVPSRSALYSGLYPFRNGAHANHSLVRDGLRTLPHYFRDLGYRVVLAGKSHIGPREVFPFEYLENGNILPPGKKELLWTDLNTGAIDKMLAKHDRAQPLCLIVAAHSPHVFWPPNEGYEPAKIDLPPYLLDTAATRAARCRYYTDVTWLDKQVGEVRASLAKHKFADNTLLMFTADQGAQWPFAKWTLYDAGIRVPLIVHWPERVKAGEKTDAIVSLIDLLPTMLAAAGATPPNDIDGRSFLPVLLGGSEHHREEAFASHTGDKEMNQAPMRCVRTSRFKYIVNLAPQIAFTTHISESDDKKAYWNSWVELAETDPAAAKLIERYQHRPAEELYDIERDPYELKNLANDPAHADALAEMREKVKKWRVEQDEDLNKVPMPADARYGELKYAG